MKKKIYTGYAVVTPDFSATSFSDYSFDTCRRYTRNGYVIVRTYRKKLGYDVRFCWMKWHKPFSFRLRWKEINLLWLHIIWSTIYTDKWDHEVIWKPSINPCKDTGCL